MLRMTCLLSCDSTIVVLCGLELGEVGGWLCDCIFFIPLIDVSGCRFALCLNCPCVDHSMYASREEFNRNDNSRVNRSAWCVVRGSSSSSSSRSNEAMKHRLV